MSNQLIPVFTGEIGNISQNIVDGRTLHAFLGCRSRFGNWMALRIKQYDFQDGIDFVWNNKIIISKGRGGSRKVIDYNLTLDMAKELSMVERTPKGKEARRYFIECERQLIKNIAAQPPSLPIRDRLAVRKEIRLTLQEAISCNNEGLRTVFLSQARKLSSEIGEPLDGILSASQMKQLECREGVGDV